MNELQVFGLGYAAGGVTIIAIWSLLAYLVNKAAKDAARPVPVSVMCRYDKTGDLVLDDGTIPLVVLKQADLVLMHLPISSMTGKAVATFYPEGAMRIPKTAKAINLLRTGRASGIRWRFSYDRSNELGMRETVTSMMRKGMQRALDIRKGGHERFDLYHVAVTPEACGND